MARMKASANMDAAMLEKRIADLFRRDEVFRRFVWTTLTDAGILWPTYTQGSPHGTSYKEGRRSLGLEILHRITKEVPDAFAVMATEGLSMSVPQPTPRGETHVPETPADDFDPDPDDPSRA